MFHMEGLLNPRKLNTPLGTRREAEVKVIALALSTSPS